jgi:hypothetical protein
MSRNNTRNRRIFTAAATVAAASLTLSQLASPAQAVPITGIYHDDPRCDAIPNQTLTHELGQNQFFPLNEALDINVTPATFTVCVPDDGIANDWIVQITNISGVTWKNLFFVADLGMKVGNADGSMEDAIGAPQVFTDAFRIDGTVTVGLNNNLLGESGPIDEVLQPGEVWRFNVSNFSGPAGAPAFPPIFRTPGVFAGSSPLLIPPVSTASILAIPVPEPTSIGIACCIGGALMLRRPRRVHGQGRA